MYADREWCVYETGRRAQGAGRRWLSRGGTGSGNGRHSCGCGTATCAPPPAPCALFVEDLTPRQLPHELHLLVDLALRRFVAEDAAEVVDFRGDELVVLGEKTLRGALEVAFRHGDLLRGTHH